MYYHLNRTMFYHQLLSAVATEISKKDLASSPLNGQEPNAETSNSSGSEMSQSNRATIKTYGKQHSIEL